MKRRDLIRQINRFASSKGLAAEYTQGSNHIKVRVGRVVTFIPRHNEIKEPLARDILKTIKEEHP